MTGIVDGRTARRDRNRMEVVEAALALMDEGEADPSVEQLTARSGLSARSIFRYFEGLDDLRRAVIRRHFDRLRPLLEQAETAEGDLDTRIRRFVDARVRFNESIARPARTAQIRAQFAPVLADDIQEYRKVMDAQVRRQFAVELKARSRAEADDVVALIDTIVSSDGWTRMVEDHGRSKAQVRRAWTLALESLLGSRAGR